MRGSRRNRPQSIRSRRLQGRHRVLDADTAAGRPHVLASAPSMSSLASLLKPIPPSMTVAAAGMHVSAARSLSTSTSNASEVLDSPATVSSVLEALAAAESPTAVAPARGSTVIFDFHARLHVTERSSGWTILDNTSEMNTNASAAGQGSGLRILRPHFALW